MFFIPFLPDVNFFIRNLPDVKMSPNFRKTPRFWTFQNFDPEISATFSEIFWTEKEKMHLKRILNNTWMSIKNTALPHSRELLSAEALRDAARREKVVILSGSQNVVQICIAKR